MSTRLPIPRRCSPFSTATPGSTCCTRARCVPPSKLLPQRRSTGTRVSSQTAAIGDTIFDTITVAGLPTPTPAGLTVSSTLLGPVPALTGANGALTCEGVDYTDAPEAGTFEVDVTGNGDYVTDDYVVTEEGCYTYVETLNTTPPVGPSTAGRATETVLVSDTPQVNTEINKQNANAGDTITDDITVTGSNGFEGTVTSVLYGPVAPLGSPAAATCVGVDYTNAPVAGTFEVEVDGDGTYTTAPFTVLVAGCYTYSETLNTVPPVVPACGDDPVKRFWSSRR